MSPVEKNKRSLEASLHLIHELKKYQIFIALIISMYMYDTGLEKSEFD